MKQYIHTIGYGGPAPLAIIFWYKGEQAQCKTICYDEQDVINMYNRHTTPGDFYNTMTPSIQMVEGGQACKQVS